MKFVFEVSEQTKVQRFINKVSTSPGLSVKLKVKIRLSPSFTNLVVLTLTKDKCGFVEKSLLLQELTISVITTSNTIFVFIFQ